MYLTGQRDANVNTQTHVLNCCQQLSNDAFDFYLSERVPRLERAPSPLRFYRDWVSPNKPVVVKNCLGSWPASTTWSLQSLRDWLSSLPVTVAVTPNGYADAVRFGRFCLPEERTMTFGSFVDRLLATDEHAALDRDSESEGLSSTRDEVWYIQKQCSNLIEEYADIVGDIDKDGLSWATESFGTAPDAVNLWIGESRAVTSLHKDNYENIYCVLRGWKKFILYPPTDGAFLPFEKFKVATYQRASDGGWGLTDRQPALEVPWIPVDPLKPDLDKYPDFSKAHRIEVVVEAGEVLYLPSLWYHHVSQSHGCISVNYWYDMNFDLKFVYQQFQNRLLCSSATLL